MSATVITGSPNISLLDSRIVADVCAGQFIIDATPSVFIGSGASNVLGVKVKITNPYGVVIKDYAAGYDIAPPITGNYTSTIPTQAGIIQYGLYTITLELTDANSTKYYVTKTVNVCTYNEDTNPCDKRVQLLASCKNGRLTILLSEPPIFKGFYSQSRTQTIVVNYPTASGLASLTSTNSAFSVQLFEGVYKVVVTVCATYNLTDNVFLRLGYTGTFEKNVKCLLDYTCIWPRIKQLNDKIAEDCPQSEKDNNASIVLDALRLIKTAELANDAGEDASPYIVDLEELLGCVCTCDCSGLPISNNAPSTNMSIEGCNVVKNIVGLTDIYTIENYSYIVAVDPAQSYISISAPALTSCVMSQQLSFSIANVYTGIKTQINNSTEYNFWAAVIDNTLDSIDATCLGYTAIQWAALTFVQKITAILNRACAGGSCAATINSTSTGQVGDDVTIFWTQTGAFAINVYVDGVLVGTVLSPGTSFTVNDVADGNVHNYLVVPICTNGSNGVSGAGTFNYLGCPVVSPPVVSSNSINNAVCPYDLTALLSTPPAGITFEWHTANNTLAGTLVADPTAVSDGVYYVFAKDAGGCYSTATTVTLICASATSCTAPQSLLVTEVSGDFRVTFNSAAFPPPSNSYTVKRRLFVDPDVSGSYTTIGTPVFNVVLNKWVITDTTGIDNTLYVYQAISNCPSSSPYITYTFANITCPTLAFTEHLDSIDYSFTPVGGEVSKYEVKIYDSTGTTLIHTDTILPSFSTPTTGTFDYLTQGTDYLVEVTVYIGTYSKICPQVGVSTLAGNIVISNGVSGNFIDSVTGISYSINSGVFPIAPGSAFDVAGDHSGYTGIISMTLTTAVSSSHMTLTVNGVLVECVNVPSPGTYAFASGTYLITDVIEITLIGGVCP